MLKALEIVGFKSFADKTRFDFPPGITVVVGPNGSGKSNVVDAIKWVLGEQSAKSLRGKDMSDVIFKGSGTTNGRRQANTAEATLVLDNTDGRLESDADEIHVTRRVFRSGEGEYLINGNACRLKDIKDLFRGTGIGTDAYSLIEQGKVDRLLQASTKDRRAIFEEAAGISRFKAKKVEAQRRLARVDQNLIRLSDIVEEVGSRYRSVKAQASKAARYREFSDRLRQLRIELGFKDWQSSTSQYSAVQAENVELESKLVQAEAQVEEVDSELAESQQELNQFSDLILDLETKASSVRESIARLEHVVSTETTRQSELQTRQEIVTTQKLDLESRLESLLQEQTELTQSATEAESQFKQQQAKLNELIGTVEQHSNQLSQRQDEEVALTSRQTDLEQRWADQQRRSFELETEVNSLGRNADQVQERLDAVTSSIQHLVIKSTEVENAEKRLANETADKDRALADARANLASLRTELDDVKQRLQDLKSERNGVAQRAEMIEEMEKRQEGVQSGAKNVLERAQKEPAGPFRDVHGMVADLIQVHVQHASLIESILGETAQYVVCDGPALKQWLTEHEPDIVGRVGFLRLDQLPKLSPAHQLDLSGLPGVIGRADQVVTVSEPFQPLIHFLLGETWIVKNLQDVFRLQSAQSNLVKYITLQSEVVRPDGSILMGPTGTELSLISRRSELRSLRLKQIELDKLIGQAEALSDELTVKAKSADEECERLLNEHAAVSKQLSQHQLERENLSQQVEKLTGEQSGFASELKRIQETKSAKDVEFAQLTEQMKIDDKKLQELIDQRATLRDKIDSGRIELDRLVSEQTELKLTTTAGEKTVEGLKESLNRSTTAMEEAQARLKETESESETNLARIAEAVAAIAAAANELTKWITQRDELTEEIVSQSERRKALVQRRDELQNSSNQLHQDVKSWQSRKHKIDLEIGQLENLQRMVSERIRDDYGIEIAELSAEKIDFVIEDRGEAESEIETLRRKITSIGAVNTDALKELEDLEERYNSLNEQFQDLVNAKESLERIIIRINSDSRKIFVETLEAIRKNFQVLYRRNFGGGKADIVLEEGVDELEAGIDIVATPPGKAEFSNSLLSGGEKALTAVSLLLAIFQFRPSPFCVLDEVDAPFDEANIGRFVEVLKGFLSWTRFVVVTHSKKTMTAADTLYGVTMLESGISTKVSVRFEDVDEKGNISDAAVKASTA